jgi:hypothetical protein
MLEAFIYITPKKEKKTLFLTGLKNLHALLVTNNSATRKIAN